MGHNLAGMSYERCEELVLYCRQMNLLVGHTNQASTKIHADIAKQETGFGFWTIRPCRVTERSAYSGKQFVDPKWLRHIIVGTQIERSDLLLLLLSCRKDNIWFRVPFPHLPNYLRAVHIRSAQIQEN